MGITTGLKMRDFHKVFAGTVILLASWSTTAIAGELYRWVDDQGIVHFGDSVPPEFSKTDRQVLNEHGVTIRELPGEKTAEQLEAVSQLPHGYIGRDRLFYQTCPYLERMG